MAQRKEKIVEGSPEHRTLGTMLKRAEKHGRMFLNPIETRVGGFAMMRKILPLYLKNKEERVPRAPLGPFRTDIAMYANAPHSGLRVTWLGHSSMLLEIDGARILIDPVWDKRASPVRWAGPKRFFEPPLPLEELPQLDAIIVSHDHYDHLGKATIQKLATLDAAKSARWVTSLGVGKILRGFGVVPGKIAELDWTGTETVVGGQQRIAITALPARHFSGRALSNRFQTLWSSFVIKGGRHCVYYGADSGWWDGFAEIGTKYGPFDLTMLETGAFHPFWSDIHLGPEGAARAFLALGGGLMMPIHWGLFDLALHAWRQPIEEIVKLADRARFKLWFPEPGRPEEVVSGQELRSAWWRANP